MNAYIIHNVVLFSGNNTTVNDTFLITTDMIELSDNRQRVDVVLKTNILPDPVGYAIVRKEGESLKASLYLKHLVIGYPSITVEVSDTNKPIKLLDVFISPMPNIDDTIKPIILDTYHKTL